MFLNLIEKDWVRGLFFALIIIGLVMVLFAAQQYLNATNRLANNPAFQSQQSGEAIPLESQAQAQLLVGSGIEYRLLTHQRDRALIIGGSGLVLLALGWLGVDFVRSQRQKASPPVHSISG